MSASALEDKEALFDRQASVSDVSRPFLQALAEGRCQDNAVKTFLYMADKYSVRFLQGRATTTDPSEPFWGRERGKQIIQYNRCTW